ncbi:hypothetical protein HF086_013870 [Spodoptera exigua]|uniref:Uncharacterized protein n=1 Tax=Spodoptera exigua TaxID=7107 RepID=A0A922SH77_SPOEX|nr:hypothetical protein HF086_013870 [Spodoptera exigua]
MATGGSRHQTNGYWLPYPCNSHIHHIQRACYPEVFEDGGVGGRSGITGLRRRRSHPHDDCVCESCPCGIVAEIVKSCRPITQTYNSSVDAATQHYQNFANVLQTAGNHLATLMQCSTSSGRQVQVMMYLTTTSTIFDSSENFTLIAKPEFESKDELPTTSVSQASRFSEELVATFSGIATKISKSLDPDIAVVPISQNNLKAASASARVLFSVEKPSTSPKTFLKSIDEIPKIERKVQKQKSKKKITKEDEPACKSVATETIQRSVETEQKPAPITDSLTSMMNCSKCVAEGKTCIGGCPNAKRKQQRMNINK